MAGRVQTKDLERLSTALASRRGDALAAWTRAVRDAARARGREPALLDLGPSLFGQWLHEPASLELPPGVDLAQTIEELGLVREALEPLSRTEARAAGRAIADLQRVAAARFVAAQEQTARALERIFAAPEADALLTALLESAPAIDSCALYSVNRTLERIAVAGLARDLSGTPDALVQLVARRGAAAIVRDASRDPLLEGSATAASGLRTVTAVPLIELGSLLGVLEAGSRTAFELGRVDETLLRAAAGRAGPLLGFRHEARRAADLQRRLALHNELALILSQPMPAAEAMRSVLESTCRHIGWDAGLCWILDPAGALGCLAMWSGEGPWAAALQAMCDEDPGTGLAAQVFATGASVWQADLAAEAAPKAAALLAAGLRHALVVPVRLGEQVLGALELFSRRVQDPARLDQVEALGRQVAQFLRRSAAQDELRASEALKTAILAAAPDAFVAVDAAARILEWNAAAERTFGWKRQEVLGRNLADVIIPSRLQHSHSDAVRAVIEGGQTDELGRHLEVPALHRDGREFPVELAITRVDRPPGPVFTVVLRDITDRKRSERASRRMTQTFQALIEASPLPIIAHDAEGRVIIWNRAAEEVSGWKRSEVLGQPDPLLPAEARVEAQALGGNGGGPNVIALEVRRPRKDGTFVDLSLSLAPLRAGRRAAPGTIAIAADITDRKRAQMEAAETAGFREQFVGIVGHDLRNPLSAISTAAQLLLRHGLSDRQARTATRVAQTAERMTRMIADLLDFTRSRLGGGFPIETRRMNLRELCETVIEELELAYPERTIEFDARGDAWGNWDPDRMAQVVSNLAGNALQHSPESSTVRVELRDEGDRVVLQTSNAGPPIPPEVLPHLFEAGRRGPPGRGHKESSGLGLGLYIVRQIVLAHGGDISARSSATEGTTFTVWLPRRSRVLP
jgi:sigma-B regulation protein RsbU (phosphoserine phosphatase)